MLPTQLACSAGPRHARHRNCWTPLAAYYTTSRTIGASDYAMPSPIPILLPGSLIPAGRREIRPRATFSCTAKRLLPGPARSKPPWRYLL
eukprot:1242250-Pleurochrysis_carterae.AAC.1